jgi:hypothetical protein
MNRRIVLFAPLLAVLVVVLAPLLVAGRLPDPIATHWSFSGTADDSGSMVVLTVAVALATLVLCALLLNQARTRKELRLTIAPWVWATTTFAAGMQVITVAANVDAASWREATLSAWLVLAAVLAAVAAAFIAHLLERGRPIGAVAPTSRATVGLRPGERAVWNARVRSPWAAVGGPVLAAALVLGAVASGELWLVLPAFIVALAVATVSEISATVDARGLSIAYGPLAWPRQRVPLDEIAEAEATQIDPLRFGGWGYRKVPRRPGATAIVIRAGEGIRVHRRDGRDLFVTVPDAGTAAGLLNDLNRRA